MSFIRVPHRWFIWHVSTQNLISRINRRLEGRDIKPAVPAKDRLPGMIEFQQLCAGLVGDEETRVRISPTLAATEVISVKLAEQLIRGAGHTADMLATARQVRDRLKGSAIVAEMLDAMGTEGLPIIVET